MNVNSECEPGCPCHKDTLLDKWSAMPDSHKKTFIFGGIGLAILGAVASAAANWAFNYFWPKQV